ncbi:MAG: hypothetical protein OXC91_00755 [Rhodobacteraceae bacterium]|nr:hypothetical protein [Paracoccaceae bacterium]
MKTETEIAMEKLQTDLIGKIYSVDRIYIETEVLFHSNVVQVTTVQAMHLVKEALDYYRENDMDIDDFDMDSFGRFESGDLFLNTREW